MRKHIDKIELIDVSLKDRKGRYILDQVSLSLPLKSIVWLSGASGSGKSVLIKILSGLIEPETGCYEINGFNLSELSFEELVPYRMNMGYSFDFGGLLNNKTIEQNLLLPLEYHSEISRNEAKERVSMLLDYFNLLPYADQIPSSVPGAMRKAACVARAFVNYPEMLLLDDPTTGLRGDLAMRLKDLIRSEVKSGRIKHVFIATDDYDFIADITTSVLVVEAGKIVQSKVQGVAA